MLTWLYGQKEGTGPEVDHMVHRPSDSRLLSNLISHEKEYSKQLQALLDSSHASLASLSAFAAATVPRISQVLLSIAGDFSGADDALGRYKDAVDAWREQLNALKDLETEVSTIIRDREILISRLLKASRNEKPRKDKGKTARRNSVINQGPHAPSSSSLSLEYVPGGPPPTSDKLAAAQTEIQACEAHLGEKERELERARITAIRDGLRIRCNALIECGLSWVEMGKDALSSTEKFRVEEGDMAGKYLGGSHPLPALPLHMQTETGSDDHHRLSSDFSSISPSQSASQVNNMAEQAPFIIPNAPNPILGANGSDIHREPTLPATHITASVAPVERPSSTPPLLPPPIGAPSPYILPRSNSAIHVPSAGLPVAEPEIAEAKHKVLPAHPSQGGTTPTTKTATFKPDATRGDSGYLTPVSDFCGSKSTLEHPYEDRITGADDNLHGRHSGEGSGLSKEQRLVKEGKLQVVENPRFQQDPTSHPPVPKAIISEEMTTARAYTPPPIAGPSHEDSNVVGVKEIRHETELPEHSTEPPPGVPSSVPTGDPQTPKKRLKRSGSPSPQKSGFLGSLKKVFGGGQHREPSMTREEKAREREEKARERERDRKEKARERELKRDEKMREQEEKREGRLRARDEKQKRQKQSRERDRQRRLLVPDSSDEDEVDIDDTDSIRGHRRAGQTSRFIGFGKKGDKWTSRTDQNLAELRREAGDIGVRDGSTSGYVVRRNVDLEKNLKGGFLSGGRAASVDLPKGRGSMQSDRGGYASGEGSRKWVPNARGTPGGKFVLQRGAKVTRSSSVPPSSTIPSSSRLLEDPITPSKLPSTSRAIPSTTDRDTRFREDLNSPTGETMRTPHKPGVPNGIFKDKGYFSDTSDLATPTRISGMPVAPAFVSPKTGAISIAPVNRKPSKKRTGVSHSHDEGEGIAGHAPSFSNATAPAGMRTGPGGRRGSVGASVAAPLSTSGTIFHHRRALSVDYGRGGPSVTASLARDSTSGSAGFRTSDTPGRNGESLMNIVDNVTRNNRQAWEAGEMDSKMNRTRGTMKSDIGSKFLDHRVGSGAPHTGTGIGSPVVGLGLNGPVAEKHSLSAPPRADRQSIMSSLKGTSSATGRAQPTKSEGFPEQKPLKSAMRSHPPEGRASPLELTASRGSTHNFATQTGKENIIPMEVLPSVSSLPVEDTNGPPPPVERIRSLGHNAADYGRDDYGEDDDSASTSSYETGHEDFDDDDVDMHPRDRGYGIHIPAPKPAIRREEDIDRRPGLGSPPFSMPIHTEPPSNSTPSGIYRSTPPSGESSPMSTPQRRKSVRVSLNPTFSPTPPAIEDEEDEADRAPFVFKEDTANTYRDTMVSGFHTPPPVKQVPKNDQDLKGSAMNIWDDDSDEDAEYKRAKSLLMRSSRREKELMGESK